VSDEASSTGTGHAEPKGRLLQAVYAFKAFMGALKGGGVWAALTVLLLTCGWLAWELQEANKRIVDILMAIKMTPPAVSPAVPATPRAIPTPHAGSAPGDFAPDAGEEPAFNPSEVLSRYHKLYRPQVEQRLAPIRELAER